MVDAAKRLKAMLLPVRRRISRRSMFHAAVIGLLVGAAAVFLLAILRWSGVRVSAWIPWLVPLVTTAVGAVVGAFRRPTLVEVARRVDLVYRLKDRTLTALQFVSRSEDPYRRLQVEDALEHLESIDPTKVVPVLVPRALPVASLLLVISWSTLIASGTGDSLVAAPPSTPEFLLQLADDLEDELLEPLKQMQEEAARELDEEQAESLDDLVQELQTMIQEIKVPGADARQALGKLSEMQAQISEAEQQFELTEVDASMREIGEALEQADATRLAGEALQNRDYKRSAVELDQMKPETPSEATRRVGDELREAAEEAAAKNQKTIADAADDLGKVMQDANASAEQQKQAASRLAKAARQTASQQALASALAKQKAKLNEAKGVARSGGKNRMRTRQPKSTWGRGASPETLNDQPTNLDSQRQREELTGVAGDGPSERQVVESSETSEQGTASEYSRRFERFERAAEAVLEQEDLPIGHRQTIRDYFEAIRPSADD